jgi:hypothetical protein
MVMRSKLMLFLAVPLAVLLLTPSADSRETKQGQIRFQQAISEGEFLSDIAALDPGLLARYSSAAVDTYCLVWYDFEAMNWQGWTQVDNTAQHGTFFHADDFAGLSGGESGRLVPIEGTKSMWCGIRPGTDDYLCSWATAPGYGNNWNQSLLIPTGHQIYFNGLLRFQYHGVFDTEPRWDIVTVSYAVGGMDNWVTIQAWDGVVDTVMTHEIALTTGKTKLRFDFISDNSYSDQDGLWPTDGACIIDEISIWDDYGVIDTEDFEEWEVGATEHTGSIWHAFPANPYGIYSGLYCNLLASGDPCNTNFGTQIVFFLGSPIWSEVYPGLYVTPFCMGPGNVEAPCQNEMVVSPVIDLMKYSTGRDENQDADIPPEDLAELAGMKLAYTAFYDQPLSNLVFGKWGVRSVDESGCPGQWRDHWMLTYGSQYGGVYYFLEEEIGDLVEGDQIQVALMCIDFCDVWYAVYGDCEEHTPAPWYDNVRVLRWKSTGPQWSYRWLDLFQDNFPEVGFDLESWVRADAANDLNPRDNPNVYPGDSIVVSCSAPMSGSLRAGGATGEAEVYLHVRAQDIQLYHKPPLYGPDLVGTCGTYVTDDGEWTVIQCDSALFGGIYVVPDKFMVDLNDSLLTRGYVVEYYFEAFDAENKRSVLPKNADRGQFFEFTCLPTGRSDVLFVDDFHGRGYFAGVTEVYWNATFSTQLAHGVIPPENQPDRYDVNSPSSMVGNGLASRADLNHLKRNEGLESGYTIIVWDSGDLEVGTITDGSAMSDKVDDCSMLINWLDQSENDVGLLICGDNIAADLSALSSVPSIQLMSSWCGVGFVHDSYFEMTGGFGGGGIVSPLLTTSASSIFGPDFTFYAFGGCPTPNNFDVLDATCYASVAVWYPDYGGDSYAAAIQSNQQNAAGYAARTMWLGFSWMFVRDDELSSPPDRYALFADIYQWFTGLPLSDITEDEVPAACKLSQNFPNPFNPATTIRFDIKKKGHVRLRIYNVAGQLVKTLVDDVMDAGSYAKEWKGSNNAGAEAASGVYFYRLEAGEYENVKKMVLLR